MDITVKGEGEATEAEKRQDIARLRAELDRFAASLPPTPDCVPLIREDRESH